MSQLQNSNVRNIPTNYFAWKEITSQTGFLVWIVVAKPLGGDWDEQSVPTIVELSFFSLNSPNAEMIWKFQKFRKSLIGRLRTCSLNWSVMDNDNNKKNYSVLCLIENLCL